MQPAVESFPPTSLIRTPILVFEPIGTVAGAPLLFQKTRPPLEPGCLTSENSQLATATPPEVQPESALPVVSSMNRANAYFGLESGTPTGSAPATVSICRISTRACALIAGTTWTPKNHGRSCWVILTSTIIEEHG